MSGLVKVPSPPVALSTSSVYPERTPDAFELAARLGYDGVEVMVYTDPVSQEADALRRLIDYHQLPIVSVHAPNLLLIQRGRPPGAGRWSVPGGRVEAGESVPAAVVRELLEETGQEGLCGSLLGWAEILDDEHHFVILDFTVTIPVAAPLVAGDDAADAAWVPLAVVGDLPLVDGLADFLVVHGVLPAPAPVPQQPR